MLKLTGIIFIIVSGGLIGLSMSERLKASREKSRILHRMFIQISAMIRYRGLNVYEIVHELNDSGHYEIIDFLKKLPTSYTAGENFNEVWHNAVTQDKQLEQDERELLISFGNMLGTSDIEGQLSALDLAIENSRSIEERRNEDYQRKGKLYRCVGLLAGIMAGVLFV